VISLFNHIRRRQTPTLVSRPVPTAAVGAYCVVEPDRELRQGEILGNLTFYQMQPSEHDHTKVDTTEGSFSYAVILSPDCDLLQDFISRRDRKSGTLFSVLLFSVENAEQAQARMSYGRQEWKHVKQNEMDRFYFLQGIEGNHAVVPSGIPDLVIDFRRYFTLSPSEIYRQCQLTDAEKRCHRICRLTDLWREDLQRRAMSYMQRVALPDPEADTR
jgi:hypothetical protein